MDGGRHNAVERADVIGIHVTPVQHPLHQFDFILHELVIQGNAPDALPVIRCLD